MFALAAGGRGSTVAGSFRIVILPEGDASPNAIGFRLQTDVKVAASDRQFATQLGSDMALLTRVLADAAPDYRTDPDFRHTFFMFKSAAETGVQHPTGDIATGQAGLDEAKRHALHTLGRRVRKIYLRRIGLGAALLVVLATAFLGVASLEVADNKLLGFTMHQWLTVAGLALLGNAISFWLAAVFYLLKLDWKKLDYLDPDGFSASMRLAIVLAVTILIHVGLYHRLVILGLGNVELNGFMQTPSLAFLIGVACGLSQVPVIGMVQRIFTPHTVREPAGQTATA